MTESASSYRIEHLKSPDNYPTWSVQVKDILSESNLFVYANGTKIKPILAADNKNKAELDEWDTKDAKALTAIRTRISQPMMTYVIGAKTSSEAWSSLKAVFDIQGPMATVLEHRKFYHYAISEGTDLEEHIRALRNSKEKLTLLEDPITEKQFNLNLLAALPASWDPFVSCIDTVSLNSNSSALIGRILQEDARRRSRSESGPAAFPAFQAQGQSNRHSGSRGPPAFNNQSNQGRQHGNRPQNRGNSSNRRPPPRLYPRRFNNNSNRQNNNHRSNNQRPSSSNCPPDGPPAYAFAVNEYPSMPGSPRRWLGDTGSQVHIVSDRSLFEEYVSTPGRTICGVGSTNVEGYGTVKLQFIVDGKSSGRVTLIDVLHVPTIPYHLISLGRLTDSTPLIYMGNSDEITIIDPDFDLIVAKGTKRNRLYEFQVEPVLPVQSFPSMLVEPGTTGMCPLVI